MSKYVRDLTQLITLDSKLAIPEYVVLYYFYLEHCQVKEGDLYFDILDPVLSKCFPSFTKNKLEELHATLEELGVMYIDENGFPILGRKEGSKVSLLCNEFEVSLVREKEALKELYEVYKDVSKKRGTLGQAVICREDIKYLLGKPFHAWATADLGLFYRRTYELVFQMPYRALLGKETGQLRRLLNLYDAGRLAKMIFEYFYHLEDYVFGKTEPTLGLFLYNKDNLSKVVMREDAITIERERLRMPTYDDTDL